MGNKKQHKEDFKKLFQDFYKDNNQQLIFEYITKNSNLPGRRGNLEMAIAFGELISETPLEFNSIIWSLLEKMIEITDIIAPTNNPKELIPFCGTVGIGSIVNQNERFFDNSFSKLRRLASDSRWRMREAVGMALMRITKNYPEKTIDFLKKWIKKDKWLEMRAIAAGLAEPELLKSNNKIPEKILEVFKSIFQEILIANEENRKKESFKVIRKGLGYCLSVVVKEIPENGFQYMEKLAQIDDKDIKWILKENLKKNRLIKYFPKKVDYIKSLIE